MQRLYITVIALLLSATLSAQTTVTREKTDEYIKITKVFPHNERKHEIRFGVGSYSHAANLFLDGFSHDVYYSGGSSLQNSIIEQSSRLTPQRFWGAYSLNYACQYRNWFQFGGTITYAFATQSRRDLESDKIVERMNCHAVSLMPTCRFTYLNRERVQLYSAVSAGVIVGTGWAFPWMDATLFGCSFGKKVFGFAELGAGLGGWGRVGIGYRFDAKKK